MRRIFLTGGGLLAICLAGFFAIGAFDRTSITDAQTMRLSADTFRLRVTAEGTLETARATPITVTVRSRRP
ncbi:MAG: hypothetical protein ABFS37_16315, partial [Acidobacteriota bacterium]